MTFFLCYRCCKIVHKLPLTSVVCFGLWWQRGAQHATQSAQMCWREFSLLSSQSLKGKTGMQTHKRKPQQGGNCESWRSNRTKYEIKRNEMKWKEVKWSERWSWVLHRDFGDYWWEFRLFSEKRFFWLPSSSLDLLLLLLLNIILWPNDATIND